MYAQKKKCSIIVLNYNGKNLLKECLPSIVEAAEYTSNTGITTEVVLLDNDSSDDSILFVQANFKNIRIERERNNFLFSYNNVLEKLSCDYAILMNNDVIVTENFVAPLLKHFDDPDVFAVGPRIYNVPGNKPFKGKMTPNFGRFHFSCTYDPDIRDACFTFVVLGAAMTVDRKKFMELGGFDELFKPGYLEDDDICYRAWKRGWKGIYEPESVVYHKWRVSMKKAYGERHIRRITERNRFFFMWKNVTGFKFTVFYCLFLPLRLLRVLVRGNTDFIRSFFMAVRRLPAVIRRRREEKPGRVLADKEIERIIATGISSKKE